MQQNLLHKLEQQIYSKHNSSGLGNSNDLKLNEFMSFPFELYTINNFSPERNQFQ